MLETLNKNGVVALKSMPIKNYSDELMESFSRMGIDAVFVFDPQYTLDQSKKVQDYLEKYDMIPLGGSFGRYSCFDISICEHTYKRFQKRINNYAN